jgi:hypothetical protein
MLKQKKSKKTKSVVMPKCNKKSQHNNNTIINHDSVISCKGDADVGGDADDEDDLDDDDDLFEEKRYKKQKPKIGISMTTENGQPGRGIHIPFTGPAEFFCPNIYDKELKVMMDAHGNICFSKIFEWILPTFDVDSFYDFLSARMHNFMLHSIKDKG